MKPSSDSTIFWVSITSSFALTRSISSGSPARPEAQSRRFRTAPMWMSSPGRYTPRSVNTKASSASFSEASTPPMSKREKSSRRSGRSNGRKDRSLPNMAVMATGRFSRWKLLTSGSSTWPSAVVCCSRYSPFLASTVMVAPFTGSPVLMLCTNTSREPSAFFFTIKPRSVTSTKRFVVA